MATNAGMKTMRLEGDLTGFGVARYDADQLANILGFSHMADKYHIDMTTRLKMPSSSLQTLELSSSEGMGVSTPTPHPPHI